ncbi:Zinc/iron permease [Athelia psychrophila]|uniref:Zinc/iron permease n=1 Tax=Athelia psychrophila TaxID=1759441 RepID=A0A166HIK5_9AGAM|nr:Zinc/iron permease [Fibularhizoctonia sp. CBS 109695]
MSGLFTILLMSTCLGLGCFTVGMLPLFFVFSKIHLTRLSILGTGLLLGAALGVIIPEGIETLSKSHPSALPTSRIALSLLTGFTFMLLIEQFTSHDTHSSHPDVPAISVTSPRATTHFDINLSRLENGPDVTERFRPDLDTATFGEPRRSERAYPLTLGLTVHGLADGLALGVSALERTESDLSFVVFLALVIHKAPTVLALTTSLLSSSLPRAECKKHVAFFSASTPLGALVSYALFSFLGAGGNGELSGTALLISGGTFLYVATVLQPISHTSAPSEEKEVNKLTRALLMVAGMFLPFAIGAVLGHGHEHSRTDSPPVAMA